MADPRALFLLLGSPQEAAIDILALLPMAMNTRTTIGSFADVHTRFETSVFPSIGGPDHVFDGVLGGATTDYPPAADWGRKELMLTGKLSVDGSELNKCDYDTVVRAVSDQEIIPLGSKTSSEMVADLVEGTHKIQGGAAFSHVFLLGVIHGTLALENNGTLNDKLVAAFLSTASELQSSAQDNPSPVTTPDVKFSASLAVSGLERLIKEEIAESGAYGSGRMTAAGLLLDHVSVTDILDEVLGPLAHLNSTRFAAGIDPGNTSIIAPIIPCGLDRFGQLNWNSFSECFRGSFSLIDGVSKASPDIAPYGIRELILALLLQKLEPTMLPFGTFHIGAAKSQTSGRGSNASF